MKALLVVSKVCGDHESGLYGLVGLLQRGGLRGQGELLLWLVVMTSIGYQHFWNG